MKTYTVYGASSHSTFRTETPANAFSVRVKAEDVFAAMGEANKMARRIGVEFKKFRHFEVTLIEITDDWDELTNDD
jgi:hypothetical protein